ncbi:hypothetical protein B0H63DRAFT_476754 [Podospora didyma]|uniref:Dicer-like protein 2 n=1 Tax=Podospora didyma TaxID=330526 RepID=A0AAE0NI09_9PEZI|nr:hypothetical protein B0H63DRAFT_476754 [Podospora didyma]
MLKDKSWLLSHNPKPPKINGSNALEIKASQTPVIVPDAAVTTKEVTTAARAYQTEMYEKSIKENIIVVMDTGSGKTLVATLRIKHELARIGAEKRVWFLTPTVELCKQQCKTLQQQIRSVEIRSFSSQDNVDGWRTKELWDTALGNVRVAVATYAVLQTALSDGFVKMGSIALIVFDEAHNCVGKSPGSKIMNDFYWRDKNAGRSVPKILGMTASPTNKVGGDNLQKLEVTLDATCKMPRIHRESLQSHVNRPVVSVEYYPTPASKLHCPSVASMRAILESLDIDDDPEIARWKSENDERSRTKLNGLQKKGNTFVRQQLKVFCDRAEAMSEQLGILAADFYIAKAKSMFIDSATAPNQSAFQTWDYSSRVYLANLLKGVQVDKGALTRVPSPSCISSKVDCLVRILTSHHCGDSGSRGIVFVTERATIAVVHHLLSQHPEIKRLFSVGPVVGSSKHDRGRRDLGDMLNTSEQSDVIGKFRTGEINLLVATSVLEEGIDVSACNLVVCFDPPPSPKSFIQRRGRARKAGSEYFILIDEAAREKAKDWEEIEEQLKAEYDREDKASALSAQVASRETSDRTFIEPTTGAVLDMENAKGRLQRFCAVIGSRRYAEKHPYYVYEELADQPPPSKDQLPLLRAKVVLPASVPYSFRITWSKKPWRSEKNASKDAAFEAYMKLYRAKLVNENLLPLSHDLKSEDMSSLIEIREQYDPWVRVAKIWKASKAPQLYSVVAEERAGSSKMSFEITIPAKVVLSLFVVSLGDGGKEWNVKPQAARSSLRQDNNAEKDGSSSSGYRLSVKDDKQQQLVVFKTPTKAATLSQLVPHILYKVEAQLVASELQRRIFFDAGSDGGTKTGMSSLIRSAITAPARGEAEYQSLEFLGDACLKLLTTVYFTAKYPDWPEGFLTTARARVISGSALCRNALAWELDQFILTKPFGADVWLATSDDNNAGDVTRSKVSSIGNSSSSPRTREIARRTLAHTVKALIGAGRQTGGYSTALSWTKSFLSEVDLPSLEVGRRQLFDRSPSDVPLPADVQLVETLAGHSFRKKSLLIEALTHSSDFTAQNWCYDRLAFLGNAVIENIVTEVIYAAAGGASSRGKMTRYRSAVVNRHFLGYLALRWHVEQTRTTVVQKTRTGFAQKQYNVGFPLWRFLKHCSSDMTAEMNAMEGRFAELRCGISKAVKSGGAYPWLLLVQLRADEFYADVVESLVGAVFVDSGSMETCKSILQRMGLLPYLMRIMKDRVDVLHPKEELQVLAGGKKIEFKLTKIPGDDKEGLTACSVYVGDSLLAEINGFACGEELEIRAATEAVVALR